MILKGSKNHGYKSSVYLLSQFRKFNFLEGEKPRIYISGYIKGTAVLRVYKVQDGYEFFKNSSSLPSPILLEEGETFNIFESIEESIKETRKKIRKREPKIPP
ncbi:MAG: hypothetical protein ABDH49_02345 [Candidatus Hydrothermales bacterium]